MKWIVAECGAQLFLFYLKLTSNEEPIFEIHKIKRRKAEMESEKLGWSRHPRKLPFKLKMTDIVRHL